MFGYLLSTPRTVIKMYNRIIKLYNRYLFYLNIYFITMFRNLIKIQSWPESESSLYSPGWNQLQVMIECLRGVNPSTIIIHHANSLSLQFTQCDQYCTILCNNESFANIPNPSGRGHKSFIPRRTLRNCSGNSSTRWGYGLWWNAFITWMSSVRFTKISRADVLISFIAN